jgi:hypothetical protein
MEARTCEKCEGRGCGSCGGVGQVQVAHDLRTYDPSTHVVVSRDRLARHIETLDSLPVTTLAVSQVAAELRAALEVGE